MAPAWSSSVAWVNHSCCASEIFCSEKRRQRMDRSVCLFFIGCKKSWPKTLYCLTQIFVNTQFMFSRKRNFVGMPQNVSRHAVVFDVRPSTENDSIVDPVVPTNSRFDYEEVRLHEEEPDAILRTTSPNAIYEFVRTLVPDEHQVNLKTDGFTTSIIAMSRAMMPR